MILVACVEIMPPSRAISERGSSIQHRTLKKTLLRRGRCRTREIFEISRRSKSRDVANIAPIDCERRLSIYDRCSIAGTCRSYGRMSGHNLLLFYVLLIAPISIALFLYGFFPVVHHAGAIASQSDIPEYIGDLRIKKHTLYKPLITKLIIMVIDGLRWDFVAGPIGKFAMPLTRSLLANSSGCLLRAKLQSPTVTMPRIKAMMTGTIPNFIDIVLNFGSKPLHSDSLLFQAKKHGHGLVFYGDDTWLSLFPHMFDRHDGTTSFFVTDFTEVDSNVTRHIRDELSHDDWTVMILHYLGLDHIGHVEGPFGTSIKPKLQEMDQIVAQISQKVQDWNNNGVPTLFVVCGDHGMKDSGGHGGSTPQETTVPFVTIGGTRCSHQEDGELIEIEQLDVTVTLSTALGLPIPSTNLGSIFLDNIYDLDDAKRLFLLHYNSRQVFDRFRKLTHHESQIEYVYRKYLDAVNLHVAWLNTSETQNGIENIVSSYNVILNEMKDAVISNIIKYDFRSMAIAVLILCQILIILFFVQTAVWTTHKKTALFFLMRFFLCLGIYYLYSFENTISFYPTSILNALLFLLVFSILCINCDLCTNSNLSLTQITKGPKIHGVLQIGSLLHLVSLASSSFVEEEHQTWYFFWTSMLAYFLYHYCTRLLVLYRHTVYNSYLTSVKMQTGVEPSYSDTRTHVELCAKLLLLLIGHRVLRKLNSTGDKWAHLPDITRWLKEDNNKIGMTLLLLTALVLLIWIAYECENKEYKQQSLFLNTAIAACIYLRHVSNGAVLKIPFYSLSNGIYEVQIFWAIILLSLLSYGYRAIFIIKCDKPRFTNMMLLFIINTWVMISAMLHQPYNVILLPMQIVASLVIDVVLRKNDLLDLGVLIHYWLGNVFYFYQGNSNSLASVDVAAGYVGLRSYMPLITCVYLIINTYSAPVLAYFLLIYYQQWNQTYCTNIVTRTSRTYVAWRLLTITIYMIIVTGQRHHLFVWSVFSPKLLYEAMYSATICCSALLTLIVITLQSVVVHNYTSHEPIQETDTRGFVQTNKFIF